jgi:hypothetical protein
MVGCSSSADKAVPSVAVPKETSKVVGSSMYGDAVEPLRRMGARLESKDNGNVTAVSLAHLDIGNEQLRHLETLTAITHLHLEGTQVSNSGLAHLTGLSSLRLVNLGDTKVTRQGRQKLRGMLKEATVFPIDLGPVMKTDEHFLRDTEKAVGATRKRGKLHAARRLVNEDVAIITMEGRILFGRVLKSTNDYVFFENADQKIRIEQSDILDILTR